ncbi:MAG: tungstate ABC transporter substrate-binding protein WtpA [Candidatus Asgardarchaeia archaeon]
MRRKILALSILVILSLSSLYLLYMLEERNERIVILHAGSLTLPMIRFKEAFQEEYPNVEVILEGYGSVDAARLIVEGGKNADILVVADYRVIEEYLFPTNYSDWYVIFARNELVIAYTNNSKYSYEISQGNWYEILNRSDVRYGHSDPNSDPCGYRTIMLWKLSNYYYGVDVYSMLNISSDRRIIRPRSVELIALLENGDLDYAFEYRSVAVQHNLSYVELPPQINLGSWNYSDFYSKVNVTLSDGKVIVGGPILYGLTIPKNAPNYELALEFVRLILSDVGKEILNELGQPPLDPALTNDVENVPEQIKAYVISYPS